MASVSISCPSCSATDGVVRNGKLREKNLINSLLLYNFLITSLMVFYMFKKSVLFATLLSGG
ncbi:hypothetical protein FHB59_14635 [Escherichia coli]|nr:hypothetical protein [Escherichia coli]